MIEKKIVIEANANFHHIEGEDLFKGSDEDFIEYRRRWKEWPESFHVGEFPLFIDVEVTSACNLKCPFCATTYRGGVIKKGNMSFDMMKKIIDEGAGKGLYGVKFNIRGEPLLHPQIDDFVRYAKEKGLIDVYFNTNAMPLDDAMSRRLIDAGLDRLSISCEGYTKDVYEKYRVGADFDTVLANIERMQAIKKELGVDHPKIRIQTVMLPELEDTFDDYRRFWSAYADEVGYLDYKEMKAKKKGVAYPWACSQIWQRMAIWWDGTILPCNHDDDGVLALGNVGEISIDSAWHSKELSDMRAAHKDGRAHEFQACDGCYLRDSEVLKLIGGEEAS